MPSLGYVQSLTDPPTGMRVPLSPALNTGSETLNRVLLASAARADIWSGKAKPKASFQYTSGKPQITATANTQDVWWRKKNSSGAFTGSYLKCSYPNSMVKQYDGQLVCSDSVKVDPKVAAAAAAAQKELEKSIVIDNSGTAMPSGWQPDVVKGLGAAATTTKADDAFLAAQAQRFAYRQYALVGALAVGVLLVWSMRKMTTPPAVVGLAYRLITKTWDACKALRDFLRGEDP